MRLAFIFCLLALLALAFVFSGCLAKKNDDTNASQAKPQGFMQNLNIDQNLVNPPSQQPAQGAGEPESQQTATISLEIGACMQKKNSIEVDNCLNKLAKEKLSQLPCTKLSVFSKDDCYSQLAGKQGNSGVCEKIYNAAKKDLCYKETGISTKDIGFCMRIKSDYNSFDICADSVARANVSDNNCLRISDMNTRDSCLTYVADKNKLRDACDYVSAFFNGSTYARDNCYIAADSNNTGENCFDFISDSQKKTCFMSAWNTPKKGTSCSGLTDENAFNACNYWAATKSQNAELCSEISDASLFKSCTSLVSSETLDTNACKVLADYKERNSCLRDLAIKASHAGTCEMISGDANTEMFCLAKVAFDTNSEAICNRMPRSETTRIALCISDIALSNSDVNRCEKIIREAEYYKCYSNIAMKFNAPEVCGLAKRTEMRMLPYTGKDYCYKDVAERKKDAMLCESISITALKNQCKTGFEKCVNDDGNCDAIYCSYLTDNDCKKPGYCDYDGECHDYTSSTLDKCVEHSCVNTPITTCTNNDKYCPSICTYEDDALANNNEDSDCLKPCAVAGGVLCQTGYYCPEKYRVFTAKEQNCCTPPQGTNCAQNP